MNHDDFAEGRGALCWGMVAVALVIAAVVGFLLLCSGAFAGERAPAWPKVRAEHLRMEPACAVCGESVHVEVHHILAYQYFPALELVQTNLITLCSGRRTKEHHLHVGHLGNFQYYNPTVREDCELIRRLVAEKGQKP
jgi:hypothetical protein